MTENLDLEKVVWSEEALLELLNIDRGTLDRLRRDEGLPVVRLTTRKRVYLASQVVAWLIDKSNKQAKTTPYQK